MITRCYYNENMNSDSTQPDGRMDIQYQPITPCPDTEELAHAGGRLMLRHTREGYPVIFWANSKTVRSGWVIGVEK